MSAKIDFNISNINNSDYKTVILRKFFNMIFVSRDGKTLRIYTATMFEGSENPKGDNTSIPEPSKNKKNTCKLKFSYNIDSSVYNEVSFEDLTSSLFEQTDCLEKVWGTCVKITTQNDLEKELKNLFPQIYSSGETTSLPSMPPNFLKFTENKKGKNFTCIAGSGKYNAENGQNHYTLSAGNIPGISAMNWVRTTISLKKSILTEKLDFKISLPHDSDFCTPDFTFYFAPPINYIVDEEIATVKIGEDDKDTKNRISRVADNTTVDFKEWVNEEAIYDSKKSRVSFNQYLSDLFYLSKKEIEIFVSFSNPVKHGNSQFFIGLIFAFLLGYCSDKTLLNDYYSCLESFCSCTSCSCKTFCNLLGILSPFLIILSFLTIIYRKENCFPPKIRRYHRLLSISKIIGIISTSVFIVYTFILWNVVPGLMSHFVGESCITNMLLSTIFYVIGLVCNIIYIVYCAFIRKKQFFDYL